MNNSLLVISHYNSRPKDQLKKLMEVTNDLAVDRLIVINDDNCKENNLKKELNNLFWISFKFLDIRESVKRVLLILLLYQNVLWLVYQLFLNSDPLKYLPSFCYKTLGSCT